MRVPFTGSKIGKMPKPVKGQDQDKGNCERGGRYSAAGYFCGGWHARAIHLEWSQRGGAGLSGPAVTSAFSIRGRSVRAIHSSPARSG